MLVAVKYMLGNTLGLCYIISETVWLECGTAAELREDVISAVATRHAVSVKIC